MTVYVLQGMAPAPWEHIGGMPEPVIDFVEPEDADHPDVVPEPTPLQVALARERVKDLERRGFAVTQGGKYRGRTVNERAAAFIRGEITVRDLDDQELQRGRFRSSDGRFRGGRPSYIPHEYHDEIVRRLLERGQERLREGYIDAVEVIVGIAIDSTVDAAVRLRAANIVQERVAGKTPDRVEMSVEVRPWERVLKGIIKTPPPDLGALVATVVEEGEDEEDD